MFKYARWYSRESEFVDTASGTRDSLRGVFTVPYECLRWLSLLVYRAQISESVLVPSKILHLETEERK